MATLCKLLLSAIRLPAVFLFDHNSDELSVRFRHGAADVLVCPTAANSLF